MMKHRTKSRVVAAVAATLLAIGVNATAANAATGPGGNVITCTISLDNPHQSGHVNGTISAQGRVSCSATVAEIYIKTSITNLNNGTVASQTYDSYNTSFGSSVGAKSCAEQGSTFKSNADVVVHFPAGYSPTPQIDNRASARFQITCGNEATDAPGGAIALELGAGDDYGATEWTIIATEQ